MNELLSHKNYANILALRIAMENGYSDGSLFEVDPPLDHYFADGLYGRRIYVPAGVTVVTKIHLQQHITIALKGHCTVIDGQGGKVDVQAPGVWVTEPGTQRAVYCHDDVEWVTVHAAVERDITTLEQKLVCDNQEEYKMKMLELKQGDLS